VNFEARHREILDAVQAAVNKREQEPEKRRIWGITTLPEGTKFTLLTRVQFRFPRSKRVRIRKKWANNPANWKHADELWSHYRVDEVEKRILPSGLCTTLTAEPVPCKRCEEGLPRRVILQMYNHQGGVTRLRLNEKMLLMLLHGRPTPFPGNIDFRIVRGSKFGYRVERV
jgi:hypothetical protein